MPTAKVEKQLRSIETYAGVTRHEARKIAERSKRISAVIATYAPHLSPYDYQCDFLDDYATRFRIFKKPRQIGASWMAAQRATVKSIVVPRHLTLMTSLNLDDATEKIEYAYQLYEEIAGALDAPPIESKSQMAINFENGSKIRAVYNPRGKAKAELIIDEYAHYLDPKKIWQATVPIMIHPTSRLTVMSTPLHSLTFFQEIWEGKGDKYKNFKRVKIHWWDCPVHCRDVAGARASMFDPEGNRLVETEEAIERFGSDTIQEIFDNMPLDQFETEFELKDMDDDTALLPMDLIMDTTPQGEASLRRYKTVHEMSGATEGQLLYAGYDVGRIRDAGELSVYVEREEGTLEECYIETFRNVPFDVQEQRCHEVLSLPNTMRLTIDATGMGMQMAENLERRWGHRALGVKFSGPQSSALASNLKMYMLNTQDRRPVKKDQPPPRKVRFLWDRSRNAQMHSIKKNISSTGGNVTYGAPRGNNNSHYRNHGDAFWSRALGVHGHADYSQLGKPRVRFM